VLLYLKAVYIEREHPGVQKSIPRLANTEGAAAFMLVNNPQKAAKPLGLAESSRRERRKIAQGGVRHSGRNPGIANKKSTAVP